MRAHFYLRHCGASDDCRLPSDIHVRCWRPRADGFPPRRWHSFHNILWWAFETLGGFASPGFAALQLEHRGEVVQRLIVTPPWYRFPFMERGDLQIGAVWTSPAARRQQLAAVAIGEAQRRFGTGGARFWYVTEAVNTPSGALAEACGFRLVATGRRTRPLGLPVLGRFVIDRMVQPAWTATHAIDPDCDEESGAGRTLSVSH